jgi:hypothetical protein
MRAGEEYIRGLYHRANDEQLFLMAAKHGYTVAWEKIDETWFQAEFLQK